MLICPYCGKEVELSLRAPVEPAGVESHPPAYQSPDEPRPLGLLRFILGGASFSLSQGDIEQAGSTIVPQPIRKYYVELPDSAGRIRKFPIKQVVRKALLAKPPGEFSEEHFTAHRARDILRRLRFTVHEM